MGKDEHMSAKTYQDSMPLAPLKIVAMGNCREIGDKINQIITARRQESLANVTDKPEFMVIDYHIENYLVDFDCPRFRTGIRPLYHL